MRLRRILVANRGEIAVRLIHTCWTLGIESVLAASDADLDSLAARRADRTVRIGAAPSSASYLSVGAIVAAARAVRADGIHPGYGFLSENARLARACDEAGIVFIGPTAGQLEALGDKLRARSHALAAGLPVVPGGEIDGVSDAADVAGEIGYPVLVKAVAGGGGRGMKVVHGPEALAAVVELARAEAQAAFGDDRVYLERFVASGRHVEVQVLGDGERVIHLGTRDCSIQRRYQKLVEEAPAPHLGAAQRDAMHRAAVAFATHLHYRGLGTVELLVDCRRDAFYFLEMNARIQVEHPVTEAVTGLDLVAEQIAVAEGRPLRIAQEELRFEGHAIECRVNAEDWTRDFRPSPGVAHRVVFPAAPHVRVDTHLQSGSRVPAHYDSLLAKLIVHGADRDSAVARLRQALGACTIDGIVTNLPMHVALVGDEEFRAGGFDTGYFPRFVQARLAGASHG